MRSVPVTAFHWTCLNLIFYGSNWKILVALHAVVIETCACWANRVMNLRGECSDLAPVSSKDCVFHRFLGQEKLGLTHFLHQFENRRWSRMPHNRTLIRKPYFTKLIWFICISHKHLIGKLSAYVYISPSQFGTANENMERISECLTWTGTQREVLCHLQLELKQCEVRSNGDTE
jgi:hypothetical protein